MKRAGGGLFLNTGSISSVVGLAGQGAYGPSKGAVVQITRQMAVEYARDGIRANAVCPGTVDTPILRRAAADLGNPADFLAGLESAHPLGRIAAAEEVAQFDVFLASDRARFFTGRAEDRRRLHGTIAGTKGGIMGDVDALREHPGAGRRRCPRTPDWVA
jgi:NAD(P)-dependent dehydrogenase (short-subunit alcohol dehydrogenase family)